jgi:hypothetical protein
LQENNAIVTSDEQAVYATFTQISINGTTFLDKKIKERKKLDIKQNNFYNGKEFRKA